MVSPNYLLFSSLFYNLNNPPSVHDCKKTHRGIVRDCQNLGMQNIPYDIFDLEGSRPSLKLANNPYVCDCSIVWFMREPKSYLNDVLDLKSITCAQPKHLAGKKISDLKEKDICSTEPVSRRECSKHPYLKNVLDCTGLSANRKPIPSDIFDRTDQKILLRGLYVCDCDIVWFIRRLKDKKLSKLIKDKDRMECYTTYQLQWERVTNVDESTVCRQKERDYCKMNPKPCNETTTICHNIKGGYKCVDIDECTMKMYKCQKGEECVNEKNGYRCQCKQRHVKDKNGVGCIVPIDPCIKCNETTDECVPGPTPGSYSCKDIDECSSKKHNCHKDADCTNMSPGYRCRCKPGFKEYSNGRDCKDINECLDKVDCAAKAKCVNSIGTFSCVCNTGYYGNGKDCEDIDECSKKDYCSTNAHCLNTDGSYKCSCNTGYQGNGKLCLDIDECSTKKSSCPTNAECVNTAGSYKCVCKTGYSWNGEYCLYIDECVSGVHTCDKNALCTNFPGGYKCLCKKGFEHFKEGRLCLKEEEEKQFLNKDNIVIAVSVPICLLIITLSIVFVIKRKNKQKKDRESSKTEVDADGETLLFLGQQNVFSDIPLEDTARIPLNMSMLSEWSEDEKDYDEDDNYGVS